MILDPGSLSLVLIVAFAAAMVGGLAGYGTGLILPPVLAPLIGGEAVVPVIAVAALFSNAGRIAAYRADLDLRLALRIVLFALPGTVLAALAYAALSGPAALVLIGVTLLLLVPLRHLARRARLVLAGRGIDAAALAYGGVVGGTAGSGILLLSILMATGQSGAAVIATDAAISVMLGSAKSGTFLLAGSLDRGLLLLALLVGLVTLPAGFLAKRIAGGIGNRAHLLILDTAVVIGACLLITQGLRA